MTMLRIIRKEFITTRWLHLITVALGLGLSVVSYLEPDKAVLMTLFTYVMYIHLLFNQCRLAVANRADNQLLNSLPLTRGQVVAGKYAYLLTCSLGFALYAVLIHVALSLLGLPMSMPPQLLLALMLGLGLLYHSLLMPLSYLDARYGTWASMAIYLAIILLPQQLGKSRGGAVLAASLTRLIAAMSGGLALGLAVLGLMAMLTLSFFISRGIYRRAEF